MQAQHLYSLTLTHYLRKIHTKSLLSNKLTRQSLRPILVLVQTGKRVWNHRFHRLHRLYELVFFICVICEICNYMDSKNCRNRDFSILKSLILD